MHKLFSYIHTILLTVVTLIPSRVFSADLYNVMFGLTQMKWIMFPTSAKLHRSCRIGHVVWRHTRSGPVTCMSPDTKVLPQDSKHNTLHLKTSLLTNKCSHRGSDQRVYTRKQNINEPHDLDKDANSDFIKSIEFVNTF